MPPSVVDAEDAPLVVKRSRRRSVEAGCLRSARESAQREEDRNVEKARNETKAVNRIRDGVASQIVTSAAMFVFLDEDGFGFISADGFAEVSAALGMNKDASMEIFKELDVFGNGQIQYGAYLELALRDGVARASTRIVEQCRQIDLEGSNSGYVARDDFRLAVQRLGWEMPSIHTLDDMFHSMDDMEDGTGQINLIKMAMRLRALGTLRQADGSTLNMMTGRTLTPRVRAPTSNRFPMRGTLEEQFHQSLNGEDRREVAAAKLEAQRLHDPEAMQRRRDAIRASRRSRESSKELSDIAEAEMNSDANLTLEERLSAVAEAPEAEGPAFGGKFRRRSIKVEPVFGVDIAMSDYRRRRSISSDIVFNQRYLDDSEDGDYGEVPTARRGSIRRGSVMDARRGSVMGEARRGSVMDTRRVSVAPPVHLLDQLKADDAAKPSMDARRGSMDARRGSIAPPVHMLDRLIAEETKPSMKLIHSEHHNLSPRAMSQQPTPRFVVGEADPVSLSARGPTRATGVPSLPKVSPRSQQADYNLNLGDPLKKTSVWDEKCAEARDRAPFDGRSTARPLFYRDRTTCVPVCTSVTRWTDPEPVPPRTPARYKVSPRRQVRS